LFNFLTDNGNSPEKLKEQIC